jgi:hypothetical protein
MGWTWELSSDSGTVSEAARDVAAQPADGFPNQAEAETWVGEVWRDLLDEGIDAVTLVEDGRRVYGPMSLHPKE